MQSLPRLYRLASILHVLCLCGFLVACIGATRLPVKAVSPSGVKIERKELDLGFLQVGSTQRDEVAHQLSMIDTSYDNPRLFWARWSESRWGYWAVLGLPCDGCMTGDAGRLWRMKNLLVTFDENGTCTRKELVSDKEIWRTLHARVADIQPHQLDTSKPIRIELSGGDPVAISMSAEKMEFERPPEKSKPNVEVPVADLLRFKHSPITEETAAPSITCHTFELAQKTAFGKKIRFCAEAGKIGVLFEYLHETAPPSMRWQ